MTHKRRDCVERPGKKGAKYTGKRIAEVTPSMIETAQSSVTAVYWSLCTLLLWLSAIALDIFRYTAGSWGFMLGLWDEDTQGCEYNPGANS